MLDGISDLADLRALDEKSLPALADELRAETIAAVSRTGGHLGAGLGVVELTVALHYIFETPRDILIWDVGHQCYPHKILTGRRSRIHTLRQKDGLSGFTQRDESEFDPFGAAHASTSISAGLGFAVARDLRAAATVTGTGTGTTETVTGTGTTETGTATGTTTKGAGEKGVNKDDDGQQRVICVIGDGAMSAGMAYEAMNNAGALGSRLIVILNDNDMSIAPPVGAMSAYLSRLLSSRSYQSTRIVSRSLASRFPRPVERTARRAEEYARGMLTGGTLFEEMGFFYVGPVDGHNLSHLLPLLRNLRTAHDRYGDAGEPFLLHVVTEKGRGYAPAEAAPDKLHGVSAGFDKVPSPKNSAPAKKETKTTTKQSAPAKAPTKQSAPAKQTTTKQTTTQSAPAKAAATKKQLPSWTRTFSAALVEAGERDSRVVAVTAAMPSGTGVDAFGARFPARCFDVGIAEQHGVTFCAGLAAAGFRPFAAIYSTFLQRGYDQVVHDVAIQGLPVRFVLDRAGLVGADGCTHHGSFDLAYLCCLPGLVVMAPADGRDLRRMVEWQSRYDAGPSAVRFPRGEVTVDDYGGEFTADLDASSSLITDALTAGVGRVVRGDGGGGVVSAVAGDSAGFSDGDGDGDSDGDGDGAGDVAILSFGALLGEALGAADLLESEGVRCCVADARFARPLDVVLLRRLAEGSRLLVTLEDGAAGGFGSCVMHWLGGEGLGVSVLPCTLPDKFIRQATRDEQLTEAGLDARSLSRRILSRYRSLN